MVLKPCAAERTIEGESNKLEEEIEFMEASSVVLKPCAAGTTTQGESSKVEEAAEPMEVSSVVLNSYLTKRKAESDPKEDEESDCEIEEGGDGKAKIEEGEAEFDMLMAPEWDVDSFNGLEYNSSDDEPLSEDEDDEEALEHYRIYKRQIIESKGFYADPELRPICYYKRIRPMSMEKEALDEMNFRKFWEEMVYVCLQKVNQDKGLNVEFVEVLRGNFRCGPRSKSYITFMAKEKPDGPLVEYQAKSMLTFDGKMHPILCRPIPTPKP